MSSHPITDLSQLPEPTRFVLGKRMQTTWFIMGIVGLCTFTIGAQIDATRMWYNYLINYFYWMCLGLGGVFFVALQYIAGATWSITLRRVGESLAAFLPIALLLSLGVIVGMHYLFEWSHADFVEAHHLIAEKSSYLNTTFFTIRQISIMLVWILFGWVLIRNSIAQDETGDVQFTKDNMKYSALFILFFALSFTLISVDLMMSLEAEWFSTIFGIYCFAGLFVSSIAMITLIATLLYRKGRFGPYVTAEHHLFDLGKYLLAFTVFWAYIAFSQYMLIWYADLPEETFYLIKRLSGAWAPVSWGLLIFNFIIPFLLLLPSEPKKKPLFLMFMAIWTLAAHYLDLYWIVVPAFKDAPVFGFYEIGMFIGFAGLFGFAVTSFLSRVPLVPKREPRLLETVNFHQ